MRIALAGTGAFGRAAYQRLVGAGHRVPLVFTDSARPIEVDGSRVTHTYITGVQEQRLLDYGIELTVAAHWTRLIGPKSRAAAPVLVGHPSLLPRHRGRSAIEWTVRMGDPVSGFTWFLADDGYDTGPIVQQAWCHVAPGWNASDLWRERLFSLGIDTLLPAVADASYGGVPQDPRYATMEPPIEPAGVTASRSR